MDNLDLINDAHSTNVPSKTSRCGTTQLEQHLTSIAFTTSVAHTDGPRAVPFHTICLDVRVFRDFGSLGRRPSAVFRTIIAAAGCTWYPAPLLL